MDEIGPFLLNDPLASFDSSTGEFYVKERLGELLPPISKGFGALEPFVQEIPWRFWADDSVREMLSILQRDATRTKQALKIRSNSATRGFENLFRPSLTSKVERPLDPGSVIRVDVSTEIMPDYLRWVEHIYGPLASIYWAVEKKGGVDGKFDLRKASELFQRQGKAVLTRGFSERVRNSIAHGEVTFTGLGIEFGAVAPLSMTIHDFLRLYDEVCRTTNALALALFIFWIPRVQASESIERPLGMVVRYAAGLVNRRGLELKGAVDSITPLVGRQLHIAITIRHRSRTQVLGESLRVAARLLEAGIERYERFLMEIDYGEPLQSLAIVKPRVLETLITEGARLDRLSEALDETQLLWQTESRWTGRLKSWMMIIESALRNLPVEFLKSWRRAEILQAAGRYRIRNMENISADGMARVRVTAVLRDPTNAENHKLVLKIIRAVVRRGRMRLVNNRPSELDRGIPLPMPPVLVHVELYKRDGTLRWLRGGGWQGANLLATAERRWSRRVPYTIKNPEWEFKSIRGRSSMDIAEAARVLGEMEQLVQDLRARARQSTDKRSEDG